MLSTIAAESENYSSGATDATFMLYVTEHVPTEFGVEEYLWALLLNVLIVLVLIS